MLEAVAQYFESSCFSWRANKKLALTTSATPRNFNQLYGIVCKLGSGGYGTVFLVARRSDGKHFAAKIIPRERCRRTTWCSRRQLDIPDEVHIWEGLNHENIAKLEESFLERGHWILVTEYHMGFHDLFDFNAGKEPRLEETEVKMIVRQVATVCLSLRDSGIDHRDIKDENLLYNPETKQIKLIDFGSATRIEPSQSYTHIQGTDVYIPKEYYTTGQYTPEGGVVWAIGCLTYILLARRSPFPSRDHVRDYETLQWASRAEDARGSVVSEEARGFVERCLESDVTARWGLDQLVESEWLGGKKGGVECRLQRHG